MTNDDVHVGMIVFIAEPINKRKRTKPAVVITNSGGKLWWVTPVPTTPLTARVLRYCDEMDAFAPETVTVRRLHLTGDDQPVPAGPTCGLCGTAIAYEDDTAPLLGSVRRSHCDSYVYLGREYCRACFKIMATQWPQEVKP